MGKKILLADDSITIQKVIELTFSDEDFDVVTVGNGRLAIEKVQEVRPDVVLCDVIMPEKDGYDVCDFIKKSPQLSATPVLLLTGAFEPFDQERAARVGCDGFLAKPFEPETLIAKVKDLLSKAAARQAPPPLPVFEPAPLPIAPPPPPHVVVAPPFSVSSSVVLPAPGTSPFQSAPPASAFVPAAPPIAVDEPEMAFIPDEPFEDLDTPSFDAPAVVAQDPVGFVASAANSVEELVPMTAEESESLSGGGDASATVMFRADSLPWTTPAHASVQAPLPPPEEQPEIVAEMPGFEEVIEETVMESEISSVIMTNLPPPFIPEPTPMPAPPPPVVVPEPVMAPAPPPPPPVVAAPPPPPPVVFVAPPPVVVAPPPPAPVVIEAPPPPPVVMVPEPPPIVVAPPPVMAPPAPPPPPPVVEPPPAVVAFAPPVLAQAPAPLPEPAHVSPPAPVAPPVEASSFADLAAEMQEPEVPATPSVAAQVDVPVDMVAQIAQRVVAQVSEKVVERIAWEVIPELAEALIKREIERLKAELQQLG